MRCSSRVVAHPIGGMGSGEFSLVVRDDVISSYLRGSGELSEKKVISLVCKIQQNCLISAALWQHQSWCCMIRLMHLKLRLCWFAYLILCCGGGGAAAIGVPCLQWRIFCYTGGFLVATGYNSATVVSSLPLCAVVYCESDCVSSTCQSLCYTFMSSALPCAF